jgi:prepilin-type N-terminal cleavage/methylation domain-containing protein
MNLKNKQGFTLLEITVVIAIFISLSIVAADFIIGGFKGNIFGYEQDAAVANARKATNAMNKEIREAAQSVRGDYLLDTVQNQTFTFYSNIDSDADTEKIRYFLDGTALKKGIIHPTGTPMEYQGASESVVKIADYINNQAMAVFTYFDKNNNQISDPTTYKKNIRLVHIMLKINVTPERAPTDYIVDTDIQIRNLKDNL